MSASLNHGGQRPRVTIARAREPWNGARRLIHEQLRKAGSHMSIAGPRIQALQGARAEERLVHTVQFPGK